MSSLTPSEIKKIEELVARLKAKQVPLEEAKKHWNKRNKKHLIKVKSYLDWHCCYWVLL
jgi:hypothetical protein